MKLRLSIWTMLIAGSLLSVPTTQAGQIPLKNEPLERQTDENVDMKRYVAAGDRAYVVDNLRVGSSPIAVSVRRAGINYVTTVSAPVGWSLTIGYTLPAKTQVKSVSPAAFQIVPTNRGEEIHVQTNSGGTQEVRIQTE